MSSPITASVNEDSALSSIRSQVAAKNDGIPFLLLPVRIETRFMTADRPTVTQGGVSTVLNEAYRTGTLLDFQVQKQTPPKVLEHMDRLESQLKTTYELVEELGQVSSTYQTAMAARMESYQSKLGQFLKSVDGLRWASRIDQMNLFKARVSLRQTAAKTTEALKGISYKRTTPFQDANNFLTRLRVLDNAMQLVGTRDLRTTDYKKKRLIFEFVEEQAAAIQGFMGQVRGFLPMNMKASSSQLSAIRKELEEISSRPELILRNVQQVRSTFKVAEYVATFGQIGKQLGNLIQDIESRLLPKIELRQTMESADSVLVLHQVLSLNDQLQRTNLRPIRNLKEVSSTWKPIQTNLNNLQNSLKGYLEGGQKEMEALTTSWDRVDIELGRYVGKLKKVKPRSLQEKKMLASIINQVNKEYRPGMEGLKSNAAGKIDFITNKDFEKSIEVVGKTLTRLKVLDGLLAKKNSPQAMEELVELSKSFSIDQRSLKILPESQFKEMQSLAGSIETKVKATSDTKFSLSDGPTSKSKTTAAITDPIFAASSLKAEIDGQASVLIETSPAIEKGELSDFVFLPTTQTQQELWVRIFPDDIAIHTHEEALTQDEVDAGQAYWYEIWAAGSDEELKLAAWRAIVAGYGPERAAWIVRTLEPVPQVSTTVNQAVAKASNPLQMANGNLADYNSGLAAGIKNNTNAFTVLEKNLDQLTAAAKLLGKIEQDTEVALEVTKKALITTKSRLTQYFGAINALSEKDKIRNASRMEAVQNTELAFNDAVTAFQKINPVTTAKLVEDTLAKLDSNDPVFPSVTIKDGSWTEVPHSKVMPDRFVVAAMRNGDWRYLEVGNPLPNDGLIVGLDPADFDLETFAYDPDGNLIVDPKIKWLTDFDEAVNVGMALWFRIEQSDWDNGFDKVVVLGIKDENATNGKELLEQLVDNHHFLPEGASFLSIGTPTNNTENRPSGFSGYEDDPSVSFKIERNSESGAAFSYDPTYPSDGERLADALGINHNTLAFLADHDQTQISDALIFNRALFHGTIGEFMEEALDTIFTLDNINRTRDFVSRYVAARGILPSVRIGTQPYGIMPATALSRFSWTGNDASLPQLSQADFNNSAAIDEELQTRFDARLTKLMDQLFQLWTSVRTNPAAPVKHSGNVGNTDPQAHFMEMLGLHANSVEHYYYYGLNVAARQNAGQPGEFSIAFDPNDVYNPSSASSAFRDLMAEGYFFKSNSFYDERPDLPSSVDVQGSRYNRITSQWVGSRVFKLRHLAESNLLIGDRIDHRKLKDELYEASDPNAGTNEEKFVARAEVENYIDWLLDNNAWDVHANNRFSTLTDQALSNGMRSRSLLFLLLRHSILSAQADTIFKILEREGLVSQNLRKRIGQTKNYYARYGGSMTYVTKWTYLFSKIHSLRYVLGNDMDTNNAFYSYMDGASSGYLNRYLSPEHTWYFNNSPRKQAHQPFMDELEETREAFRKLKTIPTAELSQLMSEHLDLVSYRMDAWYLGLVNKRLDQQRKTNPNGIYLGAYGYVEDLRRGAPRTEAASLPSGLWKPSDGPVYVDGDNQGFIHAPSIAHAITAAILRAGYHANSGVSDVDNEMAVNLSSGRVRAALNMINGIRNGQTPGAMLGYQFERALHEGYLHVPLELDQYIYDFREKFPLAAPVDSSVTLDDAAKTNVVNGLELLEFAQDFIEDNGGPNDPSHTLYEALLDKEAAFWAALGSSDLTNATQAKRHAMLKEIDRMGDTFDALGDLCLSESVYQVSQGNHIRAAAIFERLAKGDVPEEIMIADTPRTGTVVTHRVAMAIEPVGPIDHSLDTNPLPLAGAAIDAAVAAASAAPTGWTARFSPRALLDPTLNKWAGELIGDPSKIKCQADYDLNGSVSTVHFSLADLNVQALDVLHLFGTGPLNGGAELNTLVANYVRSQIPSLPTGFEGTRDDVDVTIRFTERGAGWAADEYSFYEKAGFIQSLRKMLTDSGILSADHVHIPGEEEVPDDQLRNQDFDELKIRVTNAKARLEEIATDIDNFFVNEVALATYRDHTYTNGQVDLLRNILGEAAAFGIPGTRTELVESYGDSTGRILTGALIGAGKTIGDRLERSGNEMAIVDDLSQSKDSRVDALLEVAKVLMGAAFRVIPQFVVRNATELNDQLTLAGNKGLLRSAGDFAMEEWAHGIARVRERMSNLDTLAMHTEAFDQELPGAAPMQLPFALDSGGTAEDHWLGIEFPTGYTPSEDKLSIVMYNAGVFSANPNGAQVALLLDEWVEIIPNPEETTGLAFNYDQPNAKAPNTILLAVTPTETGSWSWDDLIYTITETVDLAKNRAVEPEHLEQTYLGQILPGFMYEVVPPSEGEIIPQDDSNALGWQVITNLKANNETNEE